MSRYSEMKTLQLALLSLYSINGLEKTKPAKVDWMDVYGSMEVRSEGNLINNVYC